MTPALPAERLLLPFGAGPYRMAMSLIACPVSDIVEIDERYHDEMTGRRSLLATRHSDVFAAMPGSQPAREETLAVLADLLQQHYPGWFVRDADGLHNRLTDEGWPLSSLACDPLEVAGRLVQEDLLIIDTTGLAPVLSAAILCAPSRWRLTEKIGQPLAAIHGAVPLYGERLAAPVDRFMASLRPGRSAERLNWSVVDDDALFQPSGKYKAKPNLAITPHNAPSRLFLRVERQTFLRLPQSQAVLFLIHVHSYPLARVLAVPGAAAELEGAVRGLPDSMAAYKSLPTIVHALLPCLAGRLTAPPT